MPLAQCTTIGYRTAKSIYTELKCPYAAIDSCRAWIDATQNMVLVSVSYCEQRMS